MPLPTLLLLLLLLLLQVCRRACVAHCARAQAARRAHAVCGRGWQRPAVLDQAGVIHHGYAHIPDRGGLWGEQDGPVRRPEVVLFRGLPGKPGRRHIRKASQRVRWAMWTGCQASQAEDMPEHVSGKPEGVPGEPSR